jgi:membrane protein implicated in regulation of membrane protease activity
VALALVAFVLVAAVVVWRRSYGIAQAREIRLLDRQRAQLVAERAKLESDIRTLSGRGKLAPVAEDRLHMRIPSDSQVVIIPRPARADARR